MPGPNLATRLRDEIGPVVAAFATVVRADPLHNRSLLVAHDPRELGFEVERRKRTHPERHVDE
jgi:hypothetical protein